jgi:Anti-sigma-28 factor, FlgM
LENNYLSTLLNSIEDMDPQKLERLRKTVSDGTYSVRAEDVARKLVDYMLPHSQQAPIEGSTPELEPEERNGLTIILPSALRSWRSS